MSAVNVARNVRPFMYASSLERVSSVNYVHTEPDQPQAAHTFLIKKSAEMVGPVSIRYLRKYIKRKNLEGSKAQFKSMARSLSMNSLLSYKWTKTTTSAYT